MGGFSLAGGSFDFIQGQGSSSKGVLRGNVHLPITQGAATCQGLFVADGLYDNIVIEQNIVYTGMANGIVIDGGPTTNNIVRNNTLLNAPAWYTTAPISSLLDRVRIRRTLFLAPMARSQRMELLRSTPILVGSHTTIPVQQCPQGTWGNPQSTPAQPGSPVDFGTGMGAEQRLYQLLNP